MKIKMNMNKTIQSRQISMQPECVRLLPKLSGTTLPEDRSACAKAYDEIRSAVEQDLDQRQSVCQVLVSKLRQFNSVEIWKCIFRI